MLEDGKLWHLHCGDNLPWLESLPTGYARLSITSPPYQSARTYGIGFRLWGEDWVSWMIPRVVQMARVTDGLVCVNMAGPVRDHRYSPVVEWLVADLTRHHGLVCGPAPYAYFRIGIPGSGGPNYHRRDWEPVYCFARPECLPLKFSDNTAMGLPPRWAPGGEMSNRLSDGCRRNQWGKLSDSGARKANGERDTNKRPSHRIATKAAHRVAKLSTRHEDGQRISAQLSKRENFRHNGDGSVKGAHEQNIVRKDDEFMGYDPPVLANPGAVIREQYDAEQVRQLLMGGEVNGEVIEGSPGGDLLRCLVGGGVMGSKRAHESEAPFSERLCEFLIRSYAEEGAIVLDPFAGSGTSLAVAVRFGRRALGCELREKQCENARQRIAAEIGLFDVPVYVPPAARLGDGQASEKVNPCPADTSPCVNATSAPASG